MKSKIKIAILAMLISTPVFASEKSKFKIELDFSNRVSFGVDEIHDFMPYVKPLYKTLIPRKSIDYVTKKSEGGSTGGTGGTTEQSKPDFYQTTLPYTQRDLELAFKYISRNVRKQQNLNLRVSSDLLGIAAYLNATDTKYDESKKLEYDKLKIGMEINKPYFQFDVSSYIDGEVNKKYGIEQVDREEEIKNRSVRYNIGVTPFYNFNLEPSLKISGVDKNAKFTPEIKVKGGNFYAKLGTEFRTNKDVKNFDIKSEILDLKSLAPGYDKVEYFKDWTKKKDLPEDLKWEDDKTDYEKAEVSGYKGTDRLLGLASGSLYGDLPVKLAIREVYKVGATREFKTVGQLLDLINDREKLALIIKDQIFGHIINLIGGDESTITTTIKNYPKFATKVIDNVYDQINFKYRENTSSLNIINLIPEEFAHLPLLKGEQFDMGSYDMSKLNPHYLYHGFNEPVIKKYNRDVPNASPINQKVLSKDKQYFSVTEDFNNFVVGQLETTPFYNVVKNFINKSTFEFLLNLAKGAEDLKNTLNNPYTLEYLDLIRGFYFHNSEKGKNEYALRKKLEEILVDVKNEEYSKINNGIIDFELGYEKNGNKIAFNTKLNDGFTIKGKNYEFKRNINKYGVDLSTNLNINEKNKIYFGSKVILTDTKNSFVKADNRFRYNKYDIDMFNKLMYQSNINDSTILQLGIDHIGQFGFIKNNEFIINNKEYEAQVAKRDKKNNPLTKNGEYIDVSKHTEYELTKKAMELEENKGKFEREVLATDFIEKENGKTKKLATYKVYNIINPNLTLINKFSNNLIFTTRVDVPIAFKGKYLSGFNPSYTSSVKYIVDDKDIINATIDANAFKPYYTGNINLNYGKKNFLDYDMLLDTNIAAIKLNGTEKNVNFDLSLNPIIINVGVKPYVALEKDATSYNIKLALTTRLKDNLYRVGFKKPIYESKDLFIEKIKNPTLEILEGRNENEFKVIGPLLNDEKYYIDSKNLTYDFRPFVESETARTKKKSKLKYKFSASSVSGKYEEKGTPEYNKIKDESDFNIKNVDEINLYNYKYLYRLYKFPWPKPIYVYQFDETKEKVFEKTRRDKYFNINKYSFNLDISVENKKGFNFNSSTKLEKENTNIKVLETKEEVTEILKRKAAYMLQTSGWLGKSIDKDTLKRINTSQDLINKSKEKKDNYYCKEDKCKKDKRSEYDSEDAVRNNEKLKPTEVTTEVKTEIKSNDEIINITTNILNLTSENDLSYNFKNKDDDKLTYIVGVNSDIAVNVIDLKTLKIDGNVLYGSKKYKIKNILTPSIGIKYDIIKNASIKGSIGTPIKFIYHNDKKKLTPVKLDLNFNYNF